MKFDVNVCVFECILMDVLVLLVNLLQGNKVDGQKTFE